MNFFCNYSASIKVVTQSVRPQKIGGTSKQITLHTNISTYKTITRIGNKNSFAKSGSDCSLKFQLDAPIYWRHRIVEQSRFF